MKSIISTLLAAACVFSHASSQSTADTAAEELTMIKTLTDSLTQTISSWDGTNLTIAVGISTSSMSLVTYIQNSTKQLRGMPTTFSTSESFDIGAPTQELAYSVNASIAALIKQKAAFVKLGLGSTVVMSLNTQLSASNNFSSILLAMVPSDVRPVADALNSQITMSLNEGIACFNNMNASCITAVVNPNRTYDAAVDSGAIKATTSAATRTASFAGFAALSMAVVAAVFVL